MFKDGRIWPFIIVGLLSVSVIANVVLLIYATNDPAFSVEKDYYQKAVDWDAHQLQRAQSDALGWRVALDAGRERLEVRLTDRDGAPVAGATMRVEAFHNARAQHVVSGVLTAVGPGSYAMNHAFDRPGLWEYRLVAIKAQDRFMQTVQQDVR